MKGFKDSTKVRYMDGGMVDGYAKGGSPKGAAKIGKVMGEFKKGELHSGKDGPVVKSPAQAKAIAMSEARKAGMKAPMKKAAGGDVKMPPIGESVKSGNRMSEMEAREILEMMRREKGTGAMTEREMRMMREMKKRVPATSREPMLPPIGESVKSGNRMSEMEAREILEMMRREKGTGAMTDRDMMRRKTGGLAAMPKKGKC